ncbi:hypothetical protein QN345_13340, partial [Cryobacterium sp. 10I1]|uniref:hypothetical protein n=1 Tax=Cryobacterium sp. 10I1 TaxID=3048578 RepID=UPI002B23C4A9
DDRVREHEDEPGCCEHGDGRIEWTSPAGYSYIVEPSADMRPPRKPKPAPKPPAPIVDVWNLDPTPEDPEDPTPF